MQAKQKSKADTAQQSALRVLRAEAAALEQLAESLDDNFAEAVEIIANIDGRLVITGMGKSGHIARKIAATMASTGTPALFVHPGEASHGDMGMIVRGDAVLALSNSGEAAELGDLITYTRRFSIPLLAMTARAESTLGSRADLALIVPDCPEACPNGLAPTTSTTMMIGLGDALAIALLERHGLTAEDFKKFHPGGKLGQQLQQVSEIMHTGGEIPLLDENATMDQALLTMTEKRFGCVGLTNTEGTLSGVITDGDLRRHMDDGLLGRIAADVMTQNPGTIGKDALAAEALAIMNERKITGLFVTEDKKPVGIVHIHDCLRAGIA